MILPTAVKEPTVQEPRRLFIFSHPKIGKTELAMALPNSLLIDLEDSSGFYRGTAINVKDYCLKNNKDILEVLSEISDSIAEENTKRKGYLYDFIILDTTTVLENVARELATHLYKGSVMGKNFKGSGYEWLRQAFIKIYAKFQSLAGKCLILNGHVKFASINKDGKDLQAKDVQLTGKLKGIVCSDADAIAFMYRNKTENENILSFRTSELDLATGSRLPYLSGNEFIISKKFESDGVTPYKFDPENPKKIGIIKTYWGDSVFPSLLK
jgi:hypothetical protein